MYIFTNRRVDGDGDSFDDFRSTIDDDNSETFKIVRVQENDGDLQVETLGDSDDPAASGKTLAEQALLDLADEMRQERKNLVVYIHGFGNTLEKSVDRCRKMEELYGIKTLCISWPTDKKISFPLGALVDADPRYMRDKEDAKASAGSVRAMLLATATTLGQALDDSFSFTLAAHSMGSFVYQNVVEKFNPTGHEGFFDNILLLAPDCERANHALWINDIEVNNKLYVTVNIEDRVLAWSRHSHAHRHQRLGAYNTGYVRDNSQLEYVDFSIPSGLSSFSEHSYFVKGFRRNKKIKQFFQSAFNGQDAGKLVFDPEDKEEPTFRWKVWPVNNRHV